MNAYIWWALLWGALLFLSGFLVPLRWPATLLATATWITIDVVCIVLVFSGPARSTTHAAMLVVVCGSTAAPFVYWARLRRERHRVGREHAAKWAADRARLDVERRERLMAERAEESLADLQRRDDADPTMPSTFDRRWAEGGF